MEIINTNIKDLKIYNKISYKDKRGYTRELFRNNLIKKKFPFDLLSLSKKNVIRGLHLQRKNSQAKIITVTSDRTVTASTFTDFNFGGTASSTIWRLGSWSDTTGWPTTTTFYQERLFFANTVTKVNKGTTAALREGGRRARGAARGWAWTH